MLHGLDTQICEAINNALTFLAPKNKNFCRTRSLEYRIQHVIGTHNEGQYNWFSSVLNALGVEMSETMDYFFMQKDSLKIKRQQKQSETEQKKKWAHGFTAKLKSEILKERTEGTTYESNNYVNKVIYSGQRKS